FRAAEGRPYIHVEPPTPKSTIRLPRMGAHGEWRNDPRADLPRHCQVLDQSLRINASIIAIRAGSETGERVSAGDRYNTGEQYARGRPVATTSRKATFNLPTTLLAELGEAVAKGVAPSKNALVERALARELREARRLERRARWAEASRDPQFMRDLEETEGAFRDADAETARRSV